MSAVDGYQVDAQELQDAAAQLQALTDEVRSEAISKLDCDASAFGHPELARAAAEHADKWQRGVSTLHEDATEVANRLRSSASLYIRHEEQAAKSFDDILLPGMVPDV